MLIFRILGSIFLGISFFSMGLKNLALYYHLEETKSFGWLCWTIYGILWRAFIIVALWII